MVFQTESFKYGMIVGTNLQTAPPPVGSRIRSLRKGFGVFWECFWCSFVWWFLLFVCLFVFFLGFIFTQFGYSWYHCLHDCLISVSMKGTLGNSPARLGGGPGPPLGLSSAGFQAVMPSPRSPATLQFPQTRASSCIHLRTAYRPVSRNSFSFFLFFLSFFYRIFFWGWQVSERSYFSVFLWYLSNIVCSNTRSCACFVLLDRIALSSFTWFNAEVAEEYHSLAVCATAQALLLAAQGFYCIVPGMATVLICRQELQREGV